MKGEVRIKTSDVYWIQHKYNTILYMSFQYGSGPFLMQQILNGFEAILEK